MGISRTRRQVQNKIDNLTQKYRKEAREKTTESAPSAWPFFVELHRFLGTLPINDRSLVQESYPSPRGNVDEIIWGMETGSSLSSDEDGATEGCSVTDACSSASDLQQEPQPSTSTSQSGTSTSQLHGKRRAQKRKRMSANENFQSALLEQQAKLIAALETATQIEQGLRERQVATQEKLVDLFSKYFNK
nr:myb/SANT-like DNA-binding domain-containing protein 1 [Rhipicephalus microplus]